MPATIARAFQLREEASLAEEQGNIDRAEVLYVESKEIFLQNGNIHLVNAALNLNAIASMKAKRQDHAGALRATEHSIEILRSYIEACANGRE